MAEKHHFTTQIIARNIIIKNLLVSNFDDYSNYYMVRDKWNLNIFPRGPKKLDAS